MTVLDSRFTETRIYGTMKSTVWGMWVNEGGG